MATLTLPAPVSESPRVQSSRTQSPRSPESSRIPELDGLRGFAIAAVVAYHYSLFGPVSSDHSARAQHFYEWWRRGAALGWSGVDLFFVLSGFLIGGILLDAWESPSYYKTFYARRVFRIFPLYYLWIFSYFFVMFTIPRLLAAYPGHLVPGEGGVYWLFVFVQNVTYAGYATLGWEWLSHTWSLAVEEQFYLIAPLLIRRFTNRAVRMTMCSVVILAPLVRLCVRAHVPTAAVGLDFAYTLLPCRADALAMGVLVALLWRDQTFRDWLSAHTGALYVLAAAFAAGAIGLWIWAANAFTLLMESVGYTWLAVFYALVLLLVLQRPAGRLAAVCRTRWLCALGRVSYCVYLIHPVAGWLSHILLGSVVKQPAVWEYVASSCAAAIVVYLLARASWKDIESPLLRRGHAYQY